MNKSYNEIIIDRYINERIEERLTHDQLISNYSEDRSDNDDDFGYSYGVLDVDFIEYIRNLSSEEIAKHEYKILIKEIIE